jgi:hypothetical protein
MAMPSAGRIRIKRTTHHRGMASRTGDSQGGEGQPFVEVVGERGEGSVVREALEEFADVGDPEGARETAADFLPALRETHASSIDGKSRATLCASGGSRGKGRVAQRGRRGITVTSR